MVSGAWVVGGGADDGAALVGVDLVEGAVDGASLLPEFMARAMIVPMSTMARIAMSTMSGQVQGLRFFCSVSSTGSPGTPAAPADGSTVVAAVAPCCGMS